MVQEWPVFDIINSPSQLEQGDILEGLRIPEVDQEAARAVVRQHNVVVMTQSCDIIDGASHLIFCPLFTRQQIEEYDPHFFSQGRLNLLKSLRLIGYYPISRCQDSLLPRPWRVVLFKRVMELEKAEVMKQVAGMGNRLRIRPPYREHLAQEFARYFMRTALPTPVDMSDVSDS